VPVVSGGVWADAILGRAGDDQPKMRPMSRPQRRELESLCVSGKLTKVVLGTNGMAEIMEALQTRGLVEQVDGRWAPSVAGRALWETLVRDARGRLACLEPDCITPALGTREPYCETHTREYETEKRAPRTGGARWQRRDADDSGPGVEGATARREG